MSQPEQTISLPQAWSLLTQIHGDAAPALSTLKRHSAAGRLDAMAITAQGRRTQYKREELLAHYDAIIKAGQGAAADAYKPGAPPAPAAQVDYDQIAASVQKIVGPVLSQLQQLQKDVAEIGKVATGLVSVRNTLMAKYDASAALANDRADRLAAENASLKRGGDLEMQVTRLRADISQLTTIVRRITPED